MSSRAYCLPSDVATRFCWACWEAEALLYNIKTGDTHRALPPAGWLIEHLTAGLADSPIPENEIVDLIMRRGETPPEDTLASLSALCAIGLLKQTPIADC